MGFNSGFKGLKQEWLVGGVENFSVYKFFTANWNCSQVLLHLPFMLTTCMCRHQCQPARRRSFPGTHMTVSC